MTALTFLGTTIAVVGAGVVALSALGLGRFRDPMTRLHVAAKASSAGILLCLAGAGIASQDLAIATELLLTGAFLVLSMPLATHVLASAQHARDHSPVHHLRRREAPGTPRTDHGSELPPTDHAQDA